MARHELFEELCAAASIGQASGAELAELQEHLAGCLECQHAYSAFLQVSAVRCATASDKQKVTGDEAIGYIDSALFREKFLKRAEAEGVVFSRAKVPAGLPEPQISSPRNKWNAGFTLSAAASLLLVAGLTGGYYLRPREIRPMLRVASSPVAYSSSPVQSTAADPDRETTVDRLQGDEQKLASEIASLRSALAVQSATLAELQATAAGSEKEHASLVSSLNERQARIDDLQRQVAEAQVELASVKTQLETTEASNQSRLAADQARIRELSDQLTEQSGALSRERDLLAANRDIRELMAARNLHIADVFDTDLRGKTRRAFGRIFFTEGKSLIFYAYDLNNDHRVQNAGYNYRVWGKKEGPGQQARSLGIFYSDDKTQRRWVFEYDDPKVLSEIDSVFVTLEPPGRDAKEPKGEKLLYAYLRNQANHP